MSGYESEAWHDFFVAEAGAAAGLAGLLFVALSINIRPILATPPLTTRAGGVLSLLANVLLVATVGLVPDQSRLRWPWKSSSLAASRPPER